MAQPHHVPKPRHRDRRGGAATVQLRAAFREPGPPRPPHAARTAAERRRSYERLSARPPRQSFDPAPIVAAPAILWVVWLLVSALLG